MEGGLLANWLREGAGGSGRLETPHGSTRGDGEGRATAARLRPGTQHTPAATGVTNAAL